MFIKDPIEVNTVEDHSRAHADARDVRADPLIEEATLDPQIGDRLLTIEAALVTHTLPRLGIDDLVFAPRRSCALCEWLEMS